MHGQLIIYLLFFLLTKVTQTFHLNDTNKLYSDLLQGYNKDVRGTSDQDSTTGVAIKFSVVSINGFDEVSGTFSVIGYFEMFWKDDRMTWDVTKYNGVTSMTFPQTSVWVPVIIHSNANGDEGLQPLGYDWMIVRYLPDGTAIWSPGSLFQTYCAANIKDVQTCALTFVPAGYLPHEIGFLTISDKVSTALYTENGAWELVDTSVSNFLLGDAIHVIYVTMTIKRRATFYVVNMIIPIAVMGTLNLLVFILPAESGERVGYSITILLAICVYLTIASQNLPKTSYPALSVLGVKLLVDLIVSTCAVLFTIIGLKFYHKDDKKKVPSCIAALTRCILCKCCKKKYRKRKQESSAKGSQNSNGSSTTFVTGGSSRLYTDGIWYEMTNEPEEAEVKDITWTDVGAASDVIFFLITAIAFIASHTTYIIIVVLNTTTSGKT
ncbi:hypothetical protein FSP39_022807 [Pinctada imbricata]|uniref:Uncharacterized protein n=1 Tax=Pinctada imbricata TaxID=66713 RepID=A0AA88YCT7_PINIB|nr:hypothetical protein FSP39_022807 [Pinctada imbricata]